MAKFKLDLGLDRYEDLEQGNIDYVYLDSGVQLFVENSEELKSENSYDELQFIGTYVDKIWYDIVCESVELDVEDEIVFKIVTEGMDLKFKIERIGDKLKLSPVEAYGDWDVPASGKDSSDGGTGLGQLTDIPPANEMTGSEAENNMNGLEFGDVWATSNGEYPILAAIEDETELEVRK